MNGALTLGVVGHVDHGKTSLVRALTGSETDRLKEERERGLSIVLGFAFLETAHGTIDLIDVPGHEDFVRAMIGGATALDGIVLCIAANEGVMPQTVEHFQIARLLGVETGLVVLTKTDLADDDTLASRRAEVGRWLSGTFLEGAPVLEVSAPSGAGIDAVRAAVTRLAATPVARDSHGRFFLPLDRVFTMRGFGLVVTGTLRGGELGVGDAVEIVPAGKSSTVRALQIHHRPVERAVPGQRVAVNLRHLSRDEVGRGDVLAAPGSVVATRRLDAKLRLLEDAQYTVKNGTLVRVLTGTAGAIARLRLLDRTELAPGESGLVQLKLDRDVATRPSERFLVRSYSPLRTVGGGRILDVDTKRHRRFDASVKKRLESAGSGDIARIARGRLEEAGAAGTSLTALAESIGLGHDALEQIVPALGVIRVTEDLGVASSAFEAISGDVLAALERFHRMHPLRSGLDAGSLSNQLCSKTSPAVVQFALQQLIEQRKVDRAGELFRVAGYDPFAGLGEGQRELVRDIEKTFLASGLETPSPQTVVEGDMAKQVILRLLLETGRLVRLRTYDRSRQIVLHASTLQRAQEAIAREFPYPAVFAVKDVRDLLHSTRRHVVPLMEHLDATGATVRSGDRRRLREPSR